MQIAPWLVYALLGAVMAALAGVFAKIGTEGIDLRLPRLSGRRWGRLYVLLVTTVLGKWPGARTLNAVGGWFSWC